MSENPASPALSTVAPLPSVGELVRSAFGLVLNHPELYLAFWAASGLVTIIAATGTTLFLGLEGPEPLKAAVEAKNWAAVGAFSVLALIGAVLGGVATGAQIAASASLRTGRRPTAGECLGIGASRLPAMAWTMLLIGIAVMGGMFLLIVPGVILALRWSLAHYAVILENKSGFGASSRSSELIVPRMGKVVGNTLVFIAIAIVASIMLHLAGAVIGVLAAFSIGAGPGAFVAQVATGGLDSLVMGWLTAAQTLLYVELAARTPAAPAAA